MQKERTMKRKQQFALNRLFNIFIIVGVLLLFGAYTLICDSEIGWGIGFGVPGLISLVCPAVFSPFCYGFDCEGVTLHYLFLPDERYLWGNIRSIEVICDSTSSRSAILDLLFNTVFEISGYVEGERRFYMSGHIRKSWRTKRLLEKYWDGTITGYFWEDVKEWWNKRKNKKRKFNKHRLTDEIIPMERDIRAKAKQCMIPFHNEMAQYGFQLRKKYLYVTKNFDELNSRPSEGYTYTVLVEISRPGETDGDKIWCYSVDLVYVRLGKSAYKGVKNKYALTELQGWLTEAMDDIKNKYII